MRQPSVEDAIVIERIGTVFKKRGYVGTSLADLSASVGLKKASLYHRFPGGKEQMAKAVLEDAADFFTREIFSPLNSHLSARKKAIAVCANLSKFYHEGKLSCLLETLSLGEGENQAVQDLVKNSTDFVIEQFSCIAIESGMTKQKALKQAELAFAQLQGGLVLARIKRSPKAFKNILSQIPEILSG